MSLGAAFIAALGLRLWGIGFGLPELFHPDEPAYVLQALAVGRGLPDGLTFANPPLFKYVLLAEYGVTYALARFVGATTSPQEFIAQFRADPSQLYVIARVTSAVFGAATAVAAYALGQAVGGRRVGLIAAWLVALTYLLVRDAHFGVNDALVALLVTTGLVFCVRIARGGTRVDYVCAGALAGLAFAAKYHGIALLAPLVLAHGLRADPRRWVGDLSIGLAACVAAGVAAFPSLLTESARVVQDVYVHLYLSARGGYDGLDPAGGYVHYGRTLVIAFGWPLLLCVVIGALLGLARSRAPAYLVLVSLPVVLIAVLGSQQLFFARFLMPALPALLVVAAVSLDKLIAVRPLLGLTGIVLALAPTAVDSVRFDVLLTRPDTRTEARNWVAENVPSGAVIAVDSAPLGPTLSPERHQVLAANDWSLFDLNASEYQGRGIEYLVTSSFTSDVWLIDAAREARRQAFYAALPVEAQAIATFRPYAGAAAPPFVYDEIYAPFASLDRLERPGPTVTVFRFNAQRGTPP